VAPVPEKLGSFVREHVEEPAALGPADPGALAVPARRRVRAASPIAGDPRRRPTSVWPVGEGDLLAARVNGGGQAGYAVTFRRERRDLGRLAGRRSQEARRRRHRSPARAGSGRQADERLERPSSSRSRSPTSPRTAAAGSSGWRTRLRRAPPSTAAVFPLPQGGPGGDAVRARRRRAARRALAAGLDRGARRAAAPSEPRPSLRISRRSAIPSRSRRRPETSARECWGSPGQRATVVFLSKGKSAFELWGAILQCG